MDNHQYNQSLAALRSDIAGPDSWMTPVEVWDYLTGDLGTWLDPADRQDLWYRLTEDLDDQELDALIAQGLGSDLPDEREF
jgi:hypothetical protein